MIIAEYVKHLFDDGVDWLPASKVAYDLNLPIEKVRNELVSMATRKEVEAWCAYRVSVGVVEEPVNFILFRPTWRARI